MGLRSLYAVRPLGGAVSSASAVGNAVLMTGTDDTKECPRCSGRGKYADPQHDPLVQITCPRCEGSGRVPVDSPDEPPVKEPTQIPFGSAPKSR